MPKKLKDELTEIIFLPEYFYRSDYGGKVTWDITADACIPLAHQLQAKFDGEDKGLQLFIQDISDHHCVIRATIGKWDGIGAASTKEFPPKHDKQDRRTFFIAQIATSRAIKNALKFALNLSDMAIMELIKQYDEEGLLPQTATGKMRGMTPDIEPEPPTVMKIEEDTDSAFDELLE